MFQTDSKHVLMVSGTGHAGMEACIANLLEPGETIVVGNNGIWGSRVCDLSERYQGESCQPLPANQHEASSRPAAVDTLHMLRTAPNPTMLSRTRHITRQQAFHKRQLCADVICMMILRCQLSHGGACMLQQK